jgi:ankyrin repeat protein
MLFKTNDSQIELLRDLQVRNGECHHGAFIEKQEQSLRANAAAGNVSAVTGLLKRGVNANAADFNGYTAVHYAASSKDPQVLQLIVREYGGHTNATSASGVTPLMVAAFSGRQDSVQYLHQFDASRSSKKKAIYYASAKGHIDIVHFLCKQERCEISTDAYAAAASQVRRKQKFILKAL